MQDLSGMSDEQVVDLVRTTDQESFREIMTRYQAKLLRYATYLTHDESEAADIVQRSFINAFVHLHSYRSGLSFSSWLYRIVHNEAMNAIRRQSRLIPMPEDLEIRDPRDVTEDAVTEEDRRRVRFCLAQLPPMYAEPISLFFLEDKSYEEISDILRLPMGTIATRIRRAKEYMKRICQTNNETT